MRYRGLVYRALNPIWAGKPLSGEGARRHGGRFNPKGMAALYTSLDVLTAIRESNQVGSLQPTTLVSYEADITPVFDATDPASLARHGHTLASLAADDWRLRMREAGEAPTQALARQLVEAGYAALRVRSFARGAGPTDLNLVLWQWGPSLPTRLVLNDRDGRLSRRT
jgi:RES domain-containing protein